jgi:cleavage and polyadenylation specificity factor subunit 1
MDEMFTVEDEETGEDLQIINASFADPYLLILREDSSVKVFKTNDAAELEDIDASGLTSTKWLTASLFKPSVMSEIYALLLTQEGGLRVSSHYTLIERFDR